MWTYDSIKTHAKAQACRVTDLIALAPINDPYYVGAPNNVLWGSWFADMWHNFGYTNGVHIRRVHYRAVSQETPIIMPDGLPYINTVRCWDKLVVSSKWARYLQLVDPAAFVDQRNPDPHLFAVGGVLQPWLDIRSDRWSDSLELPDFPSLPKYSVRDYVGRQRYHLELWCEKSTMNDILLPLCREYHANMITGVGELSITACLELVRKRVASRPMRIFYISDFDPAGMSMPVAVARKVEFFLRDLAPDADVRLYPIVLTHNQVESYDLPRTPIKEGERRAGTFEGRFGAGAVELDALEALHPGELQAIVQSEFDRYFDSGLSRRVLRSQERLRGLLGEIEARVTEPYQDRIQALRIAYDQIAAEFTDRVDDMRREIDDIWLAIREGLRSAAPPLDGSVPDAMVATETDDALFDSQRGYLDQIDAYKAFQGKA
jgi:hypothetical protein